MLNKLYLLLFVLGISGTTGFCQGKHQVVKVLARVGVERYQLGTGFLMDGNDIISTCYHVIQGANQIEIEFENKEGKLVVSHRVTILGISTQYDLAQLSCPDVQGIGKTVAAGSSGFTTGEIELWSFPRGWGTYQMGGRLVSDVFSNSQKIKFGEQNIFTTAIDVLPLSTDNQQGMSGAAVVQHGRIIGIYEGGLSDGGNMGWAIPVKYLAKLVSVGHSGRSIETITSAPLTLINPAFQEKLKSFIEVAPDVQTLIDNLTDQLAEFKNYEQTLPTISSEAISVTRMIDADLVYLDSCRMQKFVEEAKLEAIGSNLSSQFAEWYKYAGPVVGKTAVLIHGVASLLNDKVQQGNLAKDLPGYRDSVGSFMNKIMEMGELIARYQALSDQHSGLLKTLGSTGAAFLGNTSDENKLAYLDAAIAYFSFVKKFIAFFDESSLRTMMRFPGVSLDLMLKIFN